MKEIGLMNINEEEERFPAMHFGGKRKSPENIEEDESNKENRVENGEVVAEDGDDKDDKRTHCEVRTTNGYSLSRHRRLKVYLFVCRKSTFCSTWV